MDGKYWLTSLLIVSQYRWSSVNNNFTTRQATIIFCIIWHRKIPAFVLWIMLSVTATRIKDFSVSATAGMANVWPYLNNNSFTSLTKMCLVFRWWCTIQQRPSLKSTNDRQLITFCQWKTAACRKFEYTHRVVSTNHDSHQAIRAVLFDLWSGGRITGVILILSSWKLTVASWRWLHQLISYSRWFTVIIILPSGSCVVNRNQKDTC